MKTAQKWSKWTQVTYQEMAFLTFANAAVQRANAAKKEAEAAKAKAQEAVQTTFDALINALVKDGRIELRNFGVFQSLYNDRFHKCWRHEDSACAKCCFHMVL